MKIKLNLSLTTLVKFLEDKPCQIISDDVPIGQTSRIQGITCNNFMFRKSGESIRLYKQYPHISEIMIRDGEEFIKVYVDSEKPLDNEQLSRIAKAPVSFIRFDYLHSVNN